jgi:hypothetical protein
MIFELTINRDYEAFTSFRHKIDMIEEATLKQALIIHVPPCIVLRHPDNDVELEIVEQFEDRFPNVVGSIPVPEGPFVLTLWKAVPLRKELCCKRLDIIMDHGGVHIVGVKDPPKDAYLVQHSKGSYWYTDQEAAVKRAELVQGTVTHYVEDINWHV